MPTIAHACSLDVVCVSTDGQQLLVLVRRARRGGTELPWAPLEPACQMEAAASGLARSVLDRAPSFVTQLGAYGDGAAHGSGCPLSVAFLAIAPSDDAVPVGAEWRLIDARLALPARQRTMLADARAQLSEGASVVISPIAFRLLPPAFTLSELQRVHELLLGRSIHTAGFRRSLAATGLVEPLDEWRSVGRGRPAQLHVYAPASGHIKNSKRL